MTEAVAANPPNADYGLDAPGTVKRMFTHGAWALGIGLVLWYVNHNEYPAPSAKLLAVLGGLGLIYFAIGGFMIWSSRVAKLALRDRLLDSLDLKGDERVLDVGCGRGLMLIGAAKRLKSGKVTGIDVWSQVDLSGNSADATKQNAKIEGVSDRVRVDTGDARKLVYPDNHYDAVVSTLAIHNIEDSAGRDQAIREMWRVL
jgi:arsenite methyltransferase